jgi:hypothetical protein
MLTYDPPERALGQKRIFALDEPVRARPRLRFQIDEAGSMKNVCSMLVRR